MVTSGSPAKGEIGISPFVRSQANAMRQAGWDVAFGLIHDRTSLRGVMQSIVRLRREIARNQPGVVHAQYGSMVSHIAKLAAGRFPLVVSFGGADLLGAKNTGLRWFVRDLIGLHLGLSAANRAAAVIVKSPNLLKALPKRLRSKTVVLPNGVDTNTFRLMDKAESRRKLGWPADSFIILFNASKTDNRRVKDPALADAAVEVARRVHANVVLQTMCDVRHEQVPLLMNAADCLLLTSLSEGSPNVVKEAMACNLPVVTVPCGDAPLRLVNTYPSHVVPPHSLFLGEAIVNLADNRRRSNGREELERQGLTNVSVAAALGRIYTVAQGVRDEDLRVNMPWPSEPTGYDEARDPQNEAGPYAVGRAGAKGQIDQVI